MNNHETPSYRSAVGIWAVFLSLHSLLRYIVRFEYTAFSLLLFSINNKRLSRSDKVNNSIVIVESKLSYCPIVCFSSSISDRVCGAIYYRSGLQGLDST